MQKGLSTVQYKSNQTLFLKTMNAAILPRKTRAKFKTSKNETQETHLLRIPNWITEDLIYAIYKQLQKTSERRRIRVTDLFPSNKTTSTPGSIVFTAEDIDKANNRTLGFIAWKLNLRTTTSEIKSSDRDEIVSAIKSSLQIE